MNPEVMPKAYRILMWVIAIALFTLIVLMGFIAVQVTSQEKEIQQLRSTSYPSSP